jgi:hypothetical protein
MEYFSNYHLITQKWADCELLRRINLLMLGKQHLTEDGLHQIVALKGPMNLGLPTSLQEVFNKVIPVDRPLVQSQIIPDPN